ncbi:MAG: hypothetical protein PUJ21_02760 [Clostridia bacterium]|nr:hypothetical protein [Clostridia bacterium]MDY6184343.1 hypothetical protein [Eubacteriales bacterium]
MNKKIQQFFSQYGFQFSGNDGYGIIDGFETNLHYGAMTTTYPVQLHFSCFLSEQQATAIVNQLLAEKHKYLAASATPYGFSLGLNDLTVGKLVAKLPEILKSVCNLLKEHGALGIGYCPVCGSVLDFESGKKCNVDGSIITIDGDCVDKINAAITQANAEFNQAPNNYFRGFLGALVGGVAGVIVSVIFYLFNFISAISSFVAFFLGSFLWTKFGGKRDKMMVFIVTVTTVVMMVLSVLGIYVVASGAAAVEAGVDMTAIEAFTFLLEEDAEFATGFATDMILTLVFCALGCGYEIFALAKKVKRADTI